MLICKQKIFSVSLAALMLVTSCNNTKQSDKFPNIEGKPINIILMIGDGMGVSQISTMFYFNPEDSEFKRFEHIGFIKTSSATNKVTDSAAAGTALATGHKTYNRGIGVTPDSVSLTSIMKLLQNKGYQTGLISLSSITDATPASFYANVTDRNMHEEIARQLVESNIDFFAGGGLKFFNQRFDGLNLTSLLKQKGYLLDSLALPASIKTEEKFAGLMANDGLLPKHEGRGQFLKEATELALNRFSGSQNGFFLMIEGSYIDWAGHAKNSEFLIAEMLDFEETLKVAIDYVDNNKNTLLIVTGDHETGGVSVEKTNNPDSVVVTFKTDQHTADLIPVFAKGFGEEQFRGFYENTDVFNKLSILTGINKNIGR